MELTDGPALVPRMASPNGGSWTAHVECESDLPSVKSDHRCLAPAGVGDRPLVDGDSENPIADRRPAGLVGRRDAGGTTSVVGGFTVVIVADEVVRE